MPAMSETIEEELERLMIELVNRKKRGLSAPRLTRRIVDLMLQER